MRIRFGIVLVIALAVAGCSRDTQVNADLDAVDAFSRDLVTKVKSAPTPGAGLDAALAHLDANRADITARMQRVGGVRGFQVGDETKQRMAQSLTSNITQVNGLKIAMVMETMRDKALETKLEKLVDEYNALIKAE